MFRETVETLDQISNQADNEETMGAADGERSRQLLRAVEAYKASCAAAGEAPTQEDAWLVLLSALQFEERE